MHYICQISARRPVYYNMTSGRRLYGVLKRVALARRRIARLHNVRVSVSAITV